jgi:hypothetical protein
MFCEMAGQPYRIVIYRAAQQATVQMQPSTVQCSLPLQRDGTLFKIHRHLTDLAFLNASDRWKLTHYARKG